MNSYIVDTHCHLDLIEQKGLKLEEIVENALQNNVKILQTICTRITEIENLLNYTKKYDFIYASAGIHPCNVKEQPKISAAEIIKICQNPKIIGIGETGLDYYYDHSPREVQRRVFAEFIHLARETGLPIVVHERDAAQDVADLLRAEGARKLRGVIHCFTGDYEAACAYLDLGFYISFTGIITFKNANLLREVVRRVPLDRMLVETDSPYLTPVPHRGKRNEPAYVQYVAETIAKIKCVSLEEVARVTTQNVRELFGV